MGNVEQGLRRLGNHRYSIKQLLALSGSACVPFDLSKFSFDAARAGVVPSLGDCGMASRRASAARPRDSSSGSVSVTEVTHAQINVDAPTHDRRPHPPPVSVLAQQHAGFARFLKKHSSPTHQRVTAGGRIVPMDSRQAPPAFALMTGKQKYSGEALDTVKKHAVVAPLSTTSPSNVSKRVPEVESFSTSTANPESEILARQHSTIHGEWKPHFSNAVCPIPLPTGNPLDVWPPGPLMNTVATPCLNLAPYNQTAFSLHVTPWGPPNPTMYSATGTWPYCDTATQFGPHAYSTTSGLTQPIIWAQNAMSEWSQRYHELDEQLKALDRHRAMTNLTSDLAQQRREIVQQRSDSKNMINLISTWLNLSEQVQPDIRSPLPNLPFNADAPAYIPVTHQVRATGPVPACPEKTTVSTTAGDIQKPPPRSARRPIAIVPPPELHVEASPIKKQAQISPKSPDLDVDPWGVKVGLAPPELRRQQSEILETISETQSHSSHSNGSQESFQSAPPGGFFQNRDNVARSGHVSKRSLDRNGVLQAEYLSKAQDTKTGYRDVPETPTELMDAPGITNMYDEMTVDIKFQHSAPPKMADASQRQGWERAQALLNAIPDRCLVQEAIGPRDLTSTPEDQAISVARQSHSAESPSNAMHTKENDTVSPSVNRKAATDAFLARFNSQESSEEVLRRQIRSTQRHHDLNHDTKRETAYATHNMPQHSRFDAFEITNREGQYVRQREGFRRYVIGSEVRTNKVPVGDHSFVGRSGNTSTDVFNTKCYSSTSVQNVHATAHMPNNIDGTVDDNKNGKSIFSLVAKIKSPRLLRRTTAYGGV